MPILLPDQLDDFVNLTLENIKRKKWTDISLDLQHLEFAKRFFGGRKDPEKGGSQLTWKIQVSNTGTARNSELFDVDVTGVVDLTKEAKIPWSKQTVNFSYDVDEDVMQTDRETIISEIKVREHSMYNDIFTLQEQNMWGMPTSTSDNPRPPSGIPYWIVKNATEGFNGGNPSGHSAGAGGLSSTDYPNWSNWTASAVDIGRDDFIAKILKAVEFTNFEAPHDYAQLAKGWRWSFATTYRVVSQLEKYLQGSNDDLGLDVGKYAGSVLVKGNPARWNSYLEENDAEDPFYGINWSAFRYFFRKGRNMVRHPAKQRDAQHSVRVVHMDSWGNFSCYDRRKCFVVYFPNGVS